MSQGDNNLSRRRFLSLSAKGAAVLPVAAAAAASGSVQAAPKLPKAGVQYQDQPKNGQRCDACAFWEGNNKCTKVKGDIAASGWCTMFAPAG
jgi:anaerobic selenocysteine-containing dehydrogenase